MNKIKYMITLAFFLMCQYVISGTITQTNKMIFTDGVIISNIVNNINMSGKSITNQASQAMLWQTNTIVVTNSFSGSIPLTANGLEISEIRLFINNTNGPMPYSAPFKYEFFNHSDRRSDNLLFSDVGSTAVATQPTTNGYLTCVTNIAVSAIGATTDVVSDASSFIIGDTVYQQQLTGGSNGYHRISNIAGNIITHGTTNRTDYAIGSLYSHVERFQIPFYYDLTLTSNLWYTFAFTANVTNSLSLVFSYYPQ